MPSNQGLIGPERWPLVIAVALAVVSVAGAMMTATGDGGVFGWVIVALAAASSLAAFAVWSRSRRVSG